MNIFKLISGLILTFTVSSVTVNATNILWTNTFNGNWSDSVNWSPNNVPGASDTAIITNSGTYTVTLDTGTTVGNFILGTTNIGGTQTFWINGQTIMVSGQAAVNASGQLHLSRGTFHGGSSGGGAIFNGVLTCSGSTLTGKFTMATNGVLNLVSALGTTNSFSGLILTNYGTVNWSNEDLSVSSASQFYNYGMWDCQTNNAFYGSTGTPTTFNNHGVFRKSGGVNVGYPILTLLDGNVVFDNSGTVDVQTGGLTIEQATDSGLINVATNRGIEVLNCLLTGSPTFSGSGVIHGNFTGSNAVVNGTLQFFSSAYLTNSSLAGSITFASNAVINLRQNPGLYLYPVYLGDLNLTNYG